MPNPSKHPSVVTQMGLVKKASKLLDGVRRRRNELQSPRQPKEENVNARSAGTFGSFVAAHKLLQRRTTVEAPRHASLGNTTKTAAMAQEVAHMHEHGTHQPGRSRIPRTMAEPQRIQIAEDDDEGEEDEDEEEQGQSDGCNHESESEDEVDESVIEDMRKLEESFRGISRKYRLINRIGEGDTSSL